MANKSINRVATLAGAISLLAIPALTETAHAGTWVMESSWFADSDIYAPDGNNSQGSWENSQPQNISTDNRDDVPTDPVGHFAVIGAITQLTNNQLIMGSISSGARYAGTLECEYTWHPSGVETAPYNLNAGFYGNLTATGTSTSPYAFAYMDPFGTNTSHSAEIWKDNNGGSGGTIPTQLDLSWYPWDSNGQTETIRTARVYLAGVTLVYRGGPAGTATASAWATGDFNSAL